MASQTKLTVSNLALLSVGMRAQVSSINPSDGSTASDAISTLYQFVFENLARTAHWNCLRNQVTLTLLAAAQGTPENPSGSSMNLPPSPWLYSYALPSDSLQVRYLIPTFYPNNVGNTVPLTPVGNNSGTYLAGGTQVPYAVAYSVDSNNNPIQVILTNLSQAQLVYTVNQSNPSIWDSLFTAAYVASLAAYLVPALSLDKGLMQMSMKQADSLIMQARVADGNEAVITQNREASWIAARSGEAGYGYGTDMGMDYNSMAWPGA